MPYTKQCKNGQCHVYKKDSGGKATGGALNKKPMTEDQANAYMAKLYEVTDGGTKALNDQELIDIEEKCYSDYTPSKRVWYDDPRAAYDPMAGRVGERACANCYWFQPGSSSCSVVAGEIVATGLSKLWMSKNVEQPVAEVAPIPVVIVNPDTGEKSIIGETDSAAVGTGKPIAIKLIDTVANLFNRKHSPVSMGFKVRPDGRWEGWWTNNAKDRVKENFSAKSIDDYIARVKSGQVPYPELWFKHYPIRMGKADILARIGYLTYASGTFYDTPVGRAGKAHYESEQKAGKTKPMSHGFLYPKGLKINGVYHAFNTFEISPLDRGEEANPYTLFEVKSMFARLDQKGLAEIAAIFGEQHAQELVNFGETKSRELENTPGVDLKSFGAGLPDDDQASAGLKKLAEATVEGLKRIGSRIDELSSKVDEVTTAADSATKAVADLKTYVDTELGFTPRASKDKGTKLAANDPQVAHLKKENETAGQKKVTDQEPLEPETEQKSIFAHIYEAAGIQQPPQGS